ncbi:hypothetical protein NLJ89_g12321 [Agrocybe chaxingu]|uniref:Uncharacterized protein n=1 Tax=Agrocybe chaxingu TaxID=84603 RepID=A0A9W8JNI3_9AGAR|nr:hypothetical protein NLJ89_g12321 [Agrocybe chaxingu]
MKRFEEELRAANVQLLPVTSLPDLADGIDLQEDLMSEAQPSTSYPHFPPDILLNPVESAEWRVVDADTEGQELEIGKMQRHVAGRDPGTAEIRIEVLSPTSPGFVDMEEHHRPSGFSEAFIEEIVEGEETKTKTEGIMTVEAKAEEKNRAEGNQDASTPSQPPPGPKHTPDTPNWAAAPLESASALPPPNPAPANQPNSSISDNHDHELNWDWRSNEPPTAAQRQANIDRWFPPIRQPFLEILGMTVLPLQYEPGVLERSVRRVKRVVKPGERDKGGEEGNKRWRGVQEELVGRLARVVL